MQHLFLFNTTKWIGEGKISFSASPDHIRFYTRWTRSTENAQILQWTQEVEMHGGDDKVSNSFVITPLTETAFSISLENELIGKAVGKGVIDGNKIAWEIKSPDTFHGFEVYELQENGDYMMHAEYVAQDNFRTIIDARIWMKEEEL